MAIHHVDVLPRDDVGERSGERGHPSKIERNMFQAGVLGESGEQRLRPTPHKHTVA